MSRSGRWVVIILVDLAVLTMAYLSFVAWEIHGAYRFVKTPGRGWSGQVHRADVELGFAPIPGARGAHLFASGPEIPMRYDGEGFRVPVGDAEGGPRRRPLVLALGGSFTYGDATPAEKTYPYRVAKALDGSAINAGVCSYGLSHMLILARRLVVEHRPDYLLVQYSPWLVKRGLSPFAPSYFGRLTNPYFYEDGDEFSLQPPVFPTVVFDYPISDYREGESSVRQFFAFFGEIGLPLLVREHRGMIGYHTRRALGVLPRPSRDYEGVLRAAYGEIAEIAAEQGTRAFIVLLDGAGQAAEFPAVAPNAPLAVIDAQAALLSRLDEITPRAFLRKYGHWRGDPPQLVDPHPNAQAHAIIARTILKGIRGE
jgi:hypothetical protein